MATFIGYNTIEQYKKYTLTDLELIKRDFLNALNIRQGESLMRPLNGSDIWSFVFEPTTPDTVRRIEDEIQRVANKDPRIRLNTVAVYSQGEGILIEIEIETVAGTGPADLRILFDANATAARYV